MRDGWMNVDENNTIINISGITVITAIYKTNSRFKLSVNCV